MKIGIDIDEVVAGYIIGFCSFYNENYGGQISMNDFKEFSIAKVLKISSEESFKLRREFLKSNYFENICLVRGALEGINKLSSYMDISFISARSLEHREKTLDFLKKHFPKNSFEVFFSGEYSGEGKTKSEICNELDIGVLIEDGEYSQRYAEEGVKIILLDKPWNKNIEHKNIIRCSNWEEILKEIKILEIYGK